MPPLDPVLPGLDPLALDKINTGFQKIDQTEAGLRGETAARSNAVLAERVARNDAISAEQQARDVGLAAEAQFRRADLLAAPIAAPIQHRPGVAPDLFTMSLAGGDPALAPPLSPTPVAVGPNGPAVRLHSEAIVAARDMFTVEPGRRYLARFAVQRQSNTPDPSNDAVKLAVAWYSANRNWLAGGDATSTVQTLLALSVGSGRTEITAVLALQPGADVGIIAPAAARFARPFVQLFGISHTTDIEIIGWRDITEVNLLAPSAAAWEGRLAAQEGVDAGSRLALLESAGAAPNSLRLDNAAALVAYDVPASVETVELLGFTSPGIGAARWKRSGVVDHAIQSLDGDYWVTCGPVVDLLQVGGSDDGATANDTAWLRARSFLAALSGTAERRLALPRREGGGVYKFTGTPDVSGLVLDPDPGVKMITAAALGAVNTVRPFTAEVFGGSLFRPGIVRSREISRAIRRAVPAGFVAAAGNRTLPVLPMSVNGHGLDQVPVSGRISEVALRRNALFLKSGVAFVEEWGNNGTAVVGDPTKPFLTLDHAVSNAAGSHVVVGSGTFSTFSYAPANPAFTQGGVAGILKSVRARIPGATIIRLAGDDLAAKTFTHIGGTDIWWTTLTTDNVPQRLVYREFFDEFGFESQLRYFPMGAGPVGYGNIGATQTAMHLYDGPCWTYDPSNKGFYISLNGPNVETAKAGLRAVYFNGSAGFITANGAKLILKDLVFDGVVVGGTETNGPNPQLYLEGCTSQFAAQNSFVASGGLMATQDCRAHSPRDDCFQYNPGATTGAMLGVEINCHATDAGAVSTYYYTLGDGSARNWNANGSTSHGGTVVARFGGLYERSFGPNIADTSNITALYQAMTWQVGVQTRECRPSVGGVFAGQQFARAEGQGPRTVFLDSCASDDDGDRGLDNQGATVKLATVAAQDTCAFASRASYSATSTYDPETGA